MMLDGRIIEEDPSNRIIEAPR